MQQTTEQMLLAGSKLPPTARLSFDRNGYTREAAVRELERITDGTELPFLIWRAGDWVLPIREAAVTGVLSRLTIDGYLSHFVESLPLFAHLDELNRVDMRSLTSAVRYHLLAEPGREALIDGLRNGDVKLRREICRVLDKAVEVEAQAVDVALRDSDSIVRRFVMRWETRLRRVDSVAAASVRRRMLADTVPLIRSAALRAMRDAEPDHAVEYLKAAVDDSSSSVRLTARHYLRGQFEFADCYRGILASMPQIGAIAGLGETGNAGDFDLILAFLNGSSKQGQAVLKALAYLDPDRVRQVCLKALLDPRAGVRRAALDLLGYRLQDDEADVVAVLWRRCSVDSGKHLGLATLRLAPWTALEVLLGALDASPDAVTDALREWRPSTNTMYLPAMVKSDQRKRLLELIDTVRPPVPVDVAKRITTALA